jgi:hypothetical protein
MGLLLSRRPLLAVVGSESGGLPRQAQRVSTAFSISRKTLNPVYPNFHKSSNYRQKGEKNSSFKGACSELSLVLSGRRAVSSSHLNLRTKGTVTNIKPKLAYQVCLQHKSNNIQASRRTQDEPLQICRPWDPRNQKNR